ncbi:MAG: translation initiation factor IF-2 [Lentimicrobiaceae bacterium]|nr:translation initiation factor IF-2 [Lentimicrobiaceae bacterium]
MSLLKKKNEIVRLSKAARDFNVGINTIVEFLHKKGVQIESSPNTKLPPEVYDLLVEAFHSDQKVKEEAKKKGLSYTQHETLTIEDSRPRKLLDEDEDQEDLIIKQVSLGGMDTDKRKVRKEKETPAPQPKAEEVVKEEPAPAAPEPVEIPAPEPVMEQQSPAQEEVSTETAPDQPAEEPVAEVATAEKGLADLGVKVLGTMDVGSLESGRKKGGKKKPAARGKEDQPAKEASETLPPADVPEETVEAREESKPEHVEVPLAESPDIPAIEQEKDPEPTAEEAPAPIEPEIPVLPEEVKPQLPAEAENFLKTEYVSLSGPTILGTMNLEELAKKERKPVASSSDDKLKAKKKRKRIKKPATAETEKPAEAKAKDKDKKAPARDRKHAPRKDERRPELTDEEIQRQIKETLANLTSKGKPKAMRHKKRKAEEVDAEGMEGNMGQKIQVTEFVSVSELAAMMDVSPTDVIAKCMEMGLFVSINQRLDAETIQVVADEFGYEVEFLKPDEAESFEDVVDDPADLMPRHPIVTVMGHVDHGKTKLLDHIRHANVVAGEAGGITQHIGAYEFQLEDGRKITFLDTPGHQAFTAMRARGAKVTDVAIIIVAADDAVMPQTIEAINHAKAAGVSIVIAINKIDKANANPEKIREQLANINILVEDWGGKYQVQEISAKAGLNIDLLLEKVLLEAELLDLKANPNRPAVGTVIESSLDKGRGFVAKMLVQNGTMRVGDVVLAGSHYGRVKAMYNERNKPVKEAGPASPVLVLGLAGAPQAGDTFMVKPDEKEAKSIALKRQQLQREQGLRTRKHITLDEIGRRIAIGDFKELNVIVKGDVDGSVEALTDELLKCSTKEVQVNVIHKDVGQVTESDILLASASNAIIVAFQVRPSLQSRRLAEQEQIDIRLYSVIYDAVNEIKEAIAGMLTPKMVEKITANLEVRDVFKITKVGTVAGCYVLDGKINRQHRVRLIRDGIVVYSGTLGSLKRFKDDVKDVATGFECGLNIVNFNDIKVGDIIEGYEEVLEVRKS